MSKYNELTKMFSILIEENHMENDIRSIYLYGSLAQDDFEKGYSDIDLWIIIKECTSVEERINITRKIIKLFDVAINKYLDSIHSDCQLKHYHYHGNWYFTEKEFIDYVKLYPTRVLYPIYFGVWKSIYGNDYVDQFKVPQHKKLVEYLMLDFEVFIREIESDLFCNNCRELIKYTMRMIKKALWILEGQYIENRNLAVCKATKFFTETNLFLEFSSWLSIAQKNNYKLDSEQQIDLCINISNIIDFLVEKIRKYLNKENIKLIQEHDVVMADLWGNFLWSFTEILTDYINIPEGNRQELILYLTDSYYQLIRYYIYVIRHKIPMDKYFGKKELPLKNSVLNKQFLEINFAKEELYKYKGTQFLLDTHMQKIIDNDFERMNELDIRKYIEQDFLREIYDLYSSIIKSK